VRRECGVRSITIRMFDERWITKNVWSVEIEFIFFFVFLFSFCYLISESVDSYACMRVCVCVFVCMRERKRALALLRSSDCEFAACGEKKKMYARECGREWTFVRSLLFARFNSCVQQKKSSFATVVRFFNMVHISGSSEKLRKEPIILQNFIVANLPFLLNAVNAKLTQLPWSQSKDIFFFFFGLWISKW